MGKEKKAPLYKQLKNDLKKQIDEGEFQKDELLPSENELCRSYNTTRATVRQALSELANMGYINRQHGKGSIVAEPKKGLGILSVRGVTTGVGDQDLKSAILKKPEKCSWPPAFFYHLSEAEFSAGCISFTRLRYLQNSPILYEETYITNLNLPRFTSRSLENRSLFKTLNKYYQVEIIGGEQKIWALDADKTISDLLKIKPGSSLVHMKRKLRTNVKDLHIYSSLYCNTAEYYLQDYF